MTIESSHGKARPSLVRASDLVPPKADANPPQGRTPGGHFAAGNRIGIGARWKATLKKALGNPSAAGDVGIVASDAARVMAHILRSLPSDAAPVRVLVGIHARHVALNAYFTRLAEVAGLETPAGAKFLETADRQSQRAERTLVTAHDLARVHAEASKRQKPAGALFYEAMANATAKDPT
jgi:hypothetical protein